MTLGEDVECVRAPRLGIQQITLKNTDMAVKVLDRQTNATIAPLGGRGYTVPTGGNPNPRNYTITGDHNK